MNLSNIIFVFSHGAGAGMDSDFMLQVSKQLTDKGIEVKRFEFPYMKKIRAEGKRRPPDRMPKLMSAFKDELIELKNNGNQKKIVIAGKSMGGRVASLLVADDNEILGIKAVVCFGFPFHPPKKQEKYRGEHLKSIKTPTLILQGERDPFGTKEEVGEYALSDKVTVKIIKDGDHSFKPRIKSGTTLDQNITESVGHIISFIQSNV